MSTWIELNEGVTYEAEALATAVFSSFIYERTEVTFLMGEVEIDIIGQISREDLASKQQFSEYRALDPDDLPEYLTLFRTENMAVFIQISGFWDDEPDTKEEEDDKGVIKAEFLLSSPQTVTVSSVDYGTPKASRIATFSLDGLIKASEPILASMLLGHPTLGDSITIKEGELWQWDPTSFDGEFIRVFNDDGEEFFVNPLWFVKG